MADYQLLKKAVAIDDHRVDVLFDNGEHGVFDCAPYFNMGYYKPLTDPAVFKCVRVSYGWLNWPGDIDIGADDVWAETVRDFSSPSLSGKAKPKNGFIVSGREEDELRNEEGALKRA